MTKRGIQHGDSRNEAIAGAAEHAEQLALKDRALAAALEGTVIADARRPDMPLIYVNSGFERITGYAANSVLGKNCRLLQGPGTDPAAAAEIRCAIAEKRECLVEILNYRKDGAPFWNRLSITPVCDGSHQLTHFIGVQSDITLQKSAEESGIERCKSRLFQDRHQPLSQSLDSLICALDGWHHDDPIRDDITLLGLEYRGAP